MLALLLWLLSSVVAVYSQCADHAFLGCVLRLKAQRVPLERNIMTLIFSIKSEAELLHTCRAYSSILPCFRERIKECGDDKQRRLLNDVGKMLMYMCSPFSLKRQRTLIENQKCVAGVLGMPASTGCKLENSHEGHQVLLCKKFCSTKQMDFLCTMKVWISEQNVCTVKDIQEKCGIIASDFYQDMQRVVFEPEFPVICEAGNETSIDPGTTTANSILIESPVTSPEVTTSVPTTITTIPAAYFNQSYPERKFVVLVNPSENVSTSTVRNILWTKSPFIRKSQYNKESWRKKPAKLTENMVVAPGFATNTVGSAVQQGPNYGRTTPTPMFSSSPKSYKVITLLKSLLPDNLPSKLTSLFENSLEKHSGFLPEDHFHTPGMTEAALTTATDRYSTSLSTAKTTDKVYLSTPTTRVGYYLGPRRKLTTKWKPWYLGGPSE